MNDVFIAAMTQFGGLGVLAVFAYLLLKSILKQQEKLGKLLDNHLTKLLDRQEIMNHLLQRIADELEVRYHTSTTISESSKDFSKERRI